MQATTDKNATTAFARLTAAMLADARAAYSPVNSSPGTCAWDWNTQRGIVSFTHQECRDWRQSRNGGDYRTGTLYMLSSFGEVLRCESTTAR